ncbi:2-hydroxy-6-oxohepta-2,4-dienoate hydrolase [Labrys miyagiensis]
MLTLSTFTAKGTPHAIVSFGKPLDAGTPHVIWAHGWGQDHHAFLALAHSLERVAHHTLIDFPGFGQSPVPPENGHSGVWDTRDYADAVAEWLGTLPRGRRVWVGHSFGGRVGLRLATNHSEAVDAMVLVGSHGLRPIRSPATRLKIFWRVRLFKALKLLERLGVDVSARKAKFGSADYRSAGAMRPVFVKVIAEDQSEAIKSIRIPVRILCGALDDQAPPEMSERLASLIPGATVNILPGLDHYTILTDGGPQVAHTVAKLLEG